MGTYRELQDRINQDYLNRSDFGEATKRAIQNAIKTYEAKRYWFNVTATAVTTTSGNAFLSAPSDLIHLDRIEVTQSGYALPLIHKTLNEVRDMNIGSATAAPTHYATYGAGWELALTPDSAYSTTVIYIHTLPLLVNDGDSNAWVTEAQNLIAHAATLDMLVSVLHVPDDARISRHAQMLSLAVKELELRNAQRLAGRIQPTKF